MRVNRSVTLPGSPFLGRLGLRGDRITPDVYPFTLPWLNTEFAIGFNAPVTFLVGENGTGKSTLLEGLAWACGFGPQVQDFLVGDRLISLVGDHLTGSLAEPKATILTRRSSCWQVFVL